MGRDRLAARSFLLSTLLVAVAFGVAAAATTETLAPVVQVAVNYAPGKSTMISGFLVGGGRFVLTQASILHGAYDTAVAFTNTDVLDPVLERFDGRLNIAVLRLPRPVRAEFAAVAELPSGELRATIVGAPTAFETGKLSVFLKPLAGGRRWEIVPAIPLAFRGAPILDSAGRLLGIAVEEPESTSVVGIPVSELRDLVPDLAVRRSSATVAAPAQPPARASQSAAVPPASASSAARPAAEPKVEGEPAPPPARASQSAAVPPVSTSNAVAPAPEPKAEGESELPKTVLEPIERPLAGVSASVPAAKVEVQPPPEPAPTVAGRPLPEEVEAEEGEARKSAAGSETATTGRSSAKQASSPLPTAADPGGWEVRIRQDPDDIQLRLRYADALLGAGDYRQTVAVLEKAQQRFPLVPRVYWYLAHAYWHQSLHKPDGGRRRSMEKKAYRKSLAAFETFLALAPDDPRAPEARYRLNLLKQAQYGRR